MPRPYRIKYPIGVFIPFKTIPCAMFPGDTSEFVSGSPAVCEVGVPYEVMMEYTEWKTLTDPPLPGIEKDVSISWIGLRPTKDSQTYLDWVIAGTGTDGPSGIFQYIGSPEET